MTKLIDKPDRVRKLHEAETPLIGGLAVLVPSFAVSVIYLVQYAHAPFMVAAVAASAFTLIVGVIDDRWGLSPVWRIVALTFAIFAVFSAYPILMLHTLRFGYVGLTGISLGPLAAPLTAIIILGFVNSANMADGMNGQFLGSMVIWSLFILWHLGPQIGEPFIAIICSTLVALVFNLRGRLFSGSAGAYAGSLFVAFGAIAAYRQANYAMSALLPVCWFWLPVLDCLRLMVSRVLDGKTPFAGDRNHFHHMLQDYMRVRFALPIYLTLLAAPGIAAEENRFLGVVVLLFCIGCYAAFVAFRQVQKRHTHVVSSTPVVTSRTAPASTYILNARHQMMEVTRKFGNGGLARVSWKNGRFVGRQNRSAGDSENVEIGG
ncbi:MAG: MraY family glycosyltransferase [Rhizomicrobium sp.]